MHTLVEVLCIQQLQQVPLSIKNFGRKVVTYLET